MSWSHFLWSFTILIQYLNRNIRKLYYITATGHLINKAEPGPNANKAHQSSKYLYKVLVWAYLKKGKIYIHSPSLLIHSLLWLPPKISFICTSLFLVICLNNFLNPNFYQIPISELLPHCFDLVGFIGYRLPSHLLYMEQQQQKSQYAQMTD